MKLLAMDLFRTAIAMRSFEHAAASRQVAEAVVVRAEFDNGTQGWGECLPRPYVTGETLESVEADLERILWPAALSLDFSDTAALADLPREAADGRCIHAAACAVELAAIDAGTLPRPNTKLATRVTGVLGSADPAKTLKRMRLMWWFGLREFKLKLGLGDDVDRENLRLVKRYMGKALTARQAELRVDVNGGWPIDDVPARIDDLVPFHVRVVEQPTFCPPDVLATLARRCSLPLLADESLRTLDDARTLRDAPSMWFNVRICKNGGLTRAAEMIRAIGPERGIVLGAMVGESGILSAAQRRLLQLLGPAAPRRVEGNYGRWLLHDDLTRPSPRFGYGGKLTSLKGPGLGVKIDPRKLERYGQLVKSLRK
ncbi:MAG: hypothetical protein FWE88_05110 [Phycisphaerae bacterium]|nr:hypothetical protein [Phycisphaerae bacterium]